MKYPRYRSQYNASQAFLKKNRDYVIEQKQKPCTDCGIQYPHYVMDFDHRPKEIKIMCIAKLVGSRKLDTLIKEIAKCDIVCSNCHRERTWKREQFSHPRLSLSRFIK